MKKCPQCQQESVDSANFCANCGASLEPPKKLSRQAKRKQEELQNKEFIPDHAEAVETKASSSQAVRENSKEESNASLQEVKEENLKTSSKTKEDEKAQKVSQEKKDEEKKVPKWHSLLFQKKSEEEEKEDDEEREDDDVDDHPEEFQRILFIAVCFLGLLVIFLSGLLIYQDFSSHSQEEGQAGEVVVQNEKEEQNNTMQANLMASVSKESQTSTKTFSLTHEEGRVLPRRAGEPRSASSESASQEEHEEKRSTSTSSSQSTSTYQANYVMNVRLGPSIEEEQVSQVEAGESIDIDKTQKNSDGSTWGRVKGSDHWVCLFDSDTQYFTEITTEIESSLLSKVDLDDLIEEAGGSLWNLFDEAVLIGDSRVYGFMSYGFLPSYQVLAAGGYTIQNIPEYLSSVALLQPNAIYLSFGINDMGLNIGQEEGENGYSKVYTRQIQSLLDQAPQATIVVNSVIDATPSAVANSPRWNKVADFNRQIKQMCKENGWIYVDNDSLAQGGKAPIYNSDGVHLVSTFYEPWAKNMLKARYSES